MKRTLTWGGLAGAWTLAVFLGACGGNGEGYPGDGTDGRPRADWKPAEWPQLEEPDVTLPGGVVSDILGKMPPGISVADALVRPGETAEVRITLGRGFGSTTVKAYPDRHVTVLELLGDQRRSVLEAETDADGRVVLERMFEQPGNYFFLATVDGKIDGREVRDAFFGVYVRESTTPLAICDLDKTLVKSGFAKVMLGMAEPFAHAPEVVHRLVTERGLTVLYLTHRPDFFGPSSKYWLRSHGFPPGPLVTSDLGGLLAGSGEFKARRIADLKAVFPNVRLAVGDKYSDVAAYRENEIRSILLPDIDWDEDDAEHWQKHWIGLEGLPGETTVCRDWFEIEKAVFGDRSFPPSRLLSEVRNRLQRAGDDD